MNAATTSNEPQTAAYQAAVDNIDNDMSLNAISILGTWFLRSGKQWNDRLDYVAELEMQIERALGKRSLGYSLDI